jgi:hypothetical protein
VSPASDRRRDEDAVPVPSHAVPGGRDAPKVRWRVLLTAGSSVTSVPRSVRIAIGSVACLLPANWLLRLIHNWGGEDTDPVVGVYNAGYWMFFVLFSAPLVVILPAMRHRRDHADPRAAAQVRVQRHVDSAPDEDAEPSRFADRPAPPVRW